MSLVKNQEINVTHTFTVHVTFLRWSCCPRHVFTLFKRFILCLYPPEKKKKKGKKGLSSAKVEEEPPKEEPKETEEIRPEYGIDGGVAPSPDRVPQMVRNCSCSIVSEFNFFSFIKFSQCISLAPLFLYIPIGSSGVNCGELYIINV